MTGGCDGGLECDPETGTPSGPVTVAEWSLSSDRQDFYDVSVIDGFNLPILVDNSGGCGTVSCPVDLTKSCASPFPVYDQANAVPREGPPELQGPTDANGTVVGCNSSCEVDSDPSEWSSLQVSLLGLTKPAGNSPNCCTGDHATPSTCPASGVKDYAFFSTSYLRS